MKKFLIGPALVLVLAFIAFVAAAPASAHSTTHAIPASTCTLDQANLTDATNADRAEDVYAPDGTLSDRADANLVYANQQLTIDGCGNGSFGSGFGGSFSFPGRFGARRFGPGFGFGVLNAAKTTQDATACADALAFISSLKLGPQHAAIAAGLVAQLQTCQGNTGTTGTSSSNCGPFCYAYPYGYRPYP